MILLIIVCLILLICELYTLKLYRFKETDNYHEINSFKKKLSDTGMVYLTFTCQNKQLNFILDTGSTISYVEESAIEGLDLKRLSCDEEAVNLGGSKTMKEYVNLILETPTTVTSIDMPLSHFGDAFADFKQNHGIEIHGLLGNNFFEASKYIIDYNKKKIFKPKSKKK